jgi:hypothetical protein
MRFIGWADFRRCSKIQNLLERDYQLKKAMGFKAASFTSIAGLLRTTGLREVGSGQGVGGVD